MILKTRLNSLLFTMIFLCSQAQAQSPIALHPDNNHYFLFRGKPTVLITSAEHYGAVMNRKFNYGLYLKTLSKEGFNYTRIFAGPYSEMGSDQFGISNNTMNPAAGQWLTPWVKDETGKYDLTTWNSEYFERLKLFISNASDNGIVVEVTLFTSWYIDKHWEISPFYFKNNTQSLDSVHFSKVNTLYNGQLMIYQENYVRKMVKELNAFDNIIFEIQNEPWSDNPNLAAYKNETDSKVFSSAWQKKVELANDVSIDWQEKIADFIKDEETRLPNRHLISQNYCNFGTRVPERHPAISVFNFHYAHPDAVMDNLNFQVAMGLDETGFMPHNDFIYRKQAWNFMMAGGALYNNLDYSFITGREDGTQPIDDRTPGWGGPVFRRQLRVLNDFMNRIDFINMKPLAVRLGNEKVIQTLAKEGEQYAIYLDNSSIKHFEYNVPPGNYRSEWINPADGTVVNDGIVYAKTGTIVAFLSFTEDILIIYTRINTNQ